MTTATALSPLVCDLVPGLESGPAPTPVPQCGAHAVAVQVQALTVSFAQRQVLHGVDLSFPARRVSVLVGRSGSGKTTLLRAINRLNEEFPHTCTTGQVRVDVGMGLESVYGKSHAGGAGGAGIRSLPDLRQRVGMLFQSPHVLPASIFANVALPLRLVAQCPEGDISQRVSTSLQAVGLWDEVVDRLHSPAQRLSGGQQQRLCLARTLALQPTILLLDEPTASLDVQATREIEALLTRLARDYTLIVVSHSPAQAARLAQHLVVLEEGRVHYTSATAMAQSVPTPRPLSESKSGAAVAGDIGSRYTEGDILRLMHVL